MSGPRFNCMRQGIERKDDREVAKEKGGTEKAGRRGKWRRE